MHCLTPIPAPSDLTSTVDPASNFWAMVPEARRADLLRHHLKRALAVVNEYQLPLRDRQERFELAVLLAVEAELLLFNAASYEPSPEDCDRFFADFLRRAFQPDVDTLQ